MKSLVSLPSHFFPCIAMASCLLLAACNANAPDQDNNPPVRKVTVLGTATIKVVPDEMRWTVNVSINDASLAAAKNRHDASLAAALSYLKSLGDAVKNLQTSGIRFDKNLYPGDDPEARRTPFSCSTQITFTLTDFEKYGPICDAMVKIDGVQVQVIDYVSSKEDATKRDALKQALANAREKASDLAATAHCTIDRPLQIQEGTIDNNAQPMAVIEDQGMRSTGGTPNAVVDRIAITATVTATYDLLPQ